MKQNSSWDEIVKVLQRHREFIIVGHSIPDGDCVGSVVGLYLGLVTLGKKVVAVLEDEIPFAYHFLPGSQKLCRHIRLKNGPDRSFTSIVLMRKGRARCWFLF